MVEGPKVAIGIEVGRLTRVGRRAKGGNRDRGGKSESGMVEGRKTALVIRRMGLVEAVEIDEATRDGEKALELAEAASAYKMASPG